MALRDQLDGKNDDVGIKMVPITQSSCHSSDSYNCSVCVCVCVRERERERKREWAIWICMYQLLTCKRLDARVRFQSWCQAPSVAFSLCASYAPVAGPSSSDTQLTSPRRRKEVSTSPTRGSHFPLLDKPGSSEPPSLKSVSVLEVLKRPEYQIENIRKEAQQSGHGSPEVVDLTDSDSPGKIEVSKSYVDG